MKSLKNLIANYSHFVSKHPYAIIILVVIVSIFAINQAKKIEMVSMDYKDMLPDDIEVMQTMDIIANQFGGADTAMIAIEIDPQYKNSDEIRDVRNPEVIKYLYLLGESIALVDDVTSVTSAASILKQINDNHLPKTKNQIISLVKNTSILSNYISSDYKMTLVKITLADDFDEDEIIDDLTKVIDEVSKPSTVKVAIAGQTLAMPIVTQQLGSDMSRTSRISLIGILIVLFLIFRSIRFGLIPLATIGVGVLWAFGFIGLIGMGMNSATSGVISMIMGIGIDFGIQTVTRFRQELKKSDPEQAMFITLNATFTPMATTTLAALIGFRAMSWGELTMMADMGTMMSYGIAACFLAAITVVPAILVIGERLTNKNLRNEDEKKLIKEEKMLLTKETNFVKRLLYSKDLKKPKKKLGRGRRK